MRLHPGAAGLFGLLLLLLLGPTAAAQSFGNGYLFGNDGGTASYNLNSPYANASQYAGTDNLDLSINGISVQGTTNEYYVNGASGGGTVSAVSANSQAGQLLLSTGEFTEVDGQVLISPSETSTPSNVSVGYNGGTVQQAGGNGTVTLHVGSAYVPPPPVYSPPPTYSPPTYTPPPVYSPPVSWAVGLSATNTHPTPGQAVTLTATASANVGPTPWYIRITDATTGQTLASCGSGTTCTAGETEYGGTTQTFRATVASWDGQAVQAASAPVTVTWASPIIPVSVGSVSFSANPVVSGSRDTVTVATSGPVSSVTANLPWGGSVALSGGGTTWSGTFTAPEVSGDSAYAVPVTARGAQGQTASGSGGLTVAGRIAIDGATASPNPVLRGETVQIAVSTAGPVRSVSVWAPWAGTVGLAGGGGNWSASLPANGPAGEAALNITAYGPAGQVVQRTLSLMVVDRIAIAGASLSPNPALYGQPVRLEVSTTGPAGSVTATLPWGGEVGLAGAGSMWSATFADGGDPGQRAWVSFPITVTALGPLGQRASDIVTLTSRSPAPSVVAVTITGPSGNGVGEFGQTVTVSARVGGGPATTVTAAFDWSNVSIADVPVPPMTVTLAPNPGRPGTWTGTWKVAAWPFTGAAPDSQDLQPVPVTVAVTAQGPGGVAHGTGSLLVNGTVLYPVVVPGYPSTNGTGS
jgi:hypothetical protein